MDKKEKDVQYHPPACAALELELRADQEVLDFQPELNLNTLPNKVDVLVVKKKPAVQLHSGLGTIFRKYNLWEYKNPNDKLNEKIYFRMLGYAGLFLAYQADTDDVSEITLSFMREKKPVKLMGWLKKNGFCITEYQKGIYHIKKSGHYDMQIVVTSETDVDLYRWVTKLSSNVKEEDVRKLSDTLKDLHSSRDLQNAEAVYELMFRLNKDKKWSREELNTMGYLRDLFKEEFEMRDKKIEQQSEQLEQKDVQLEQKDAQLEQKDAKIIDLQARIAELEAELNKKQG